ncbi:MAG: hypothetical protein QJR00_03460 [Bacillota bacterium]|nr:hypothetical protein [Bacillota bacterium]
MWAVAYEPKVLPAGWTEEEDQLLKETVRQMLPRAGNLTVIASGLQRRLKRQPRRILDRIQTLRRWDAEFDRFIRQNVRTMIGPSQNNGIAHEEGRVASPRRRQRERNRPAVAFSPRVDESLFLVKWASRYLGDLHPEQTEKVRKLVQQHGALTVGLALAEGAMEGTQLILNRAREILRDEEVSMLLDE